MSSMVHRIHRSIVVVMLRDSDSQRVTGAYMLEYRWVRAWNQDIW